MEKINSKSKSNNLNLNSTIMSIIVLIGALAVIICAIVNLAVSRRISWSIFVLGSVSYFIAIAYTSIATKKSKLEKTVICASVLLIPFLAVLQFAQAYMTNVRFDIWFTAVGLPIAVTWIVVVWIWMVLIHVIKSNWFINIAMLCLLSVPGTMITNYIAGIYKTIPQVRVGLFINGLTALLVGIILFAFGLKMQRTQQTHG